MTSNPTIDTSPWKWEPPVWRNGLYTIEAFQKTQPVNGATNGTYGYLVYKHGRIVPGQRIPHGHDSVDAAMDFFAEMVGGNEIAGQPPRLPEVNGYQISATVYGIESVWHDGEVEIVELLRDDLFEDRGDAEQCADRLTAAVVPLAGHAPTVYRAVPINVRATGATS